MLRSGNGGRLPGASTPGLVAQQSTARRCVRFPTRCSPEFCDYAVLGLTPFASRSDVKHAYKRLALKYHLDVIRGENLSVKHQIFKDVKSTYESLMQKFAEEELQAVAGSEEFDEWEEWMGFEGGIPAVYSPF